ncbi:MAG: transposase family protein, partial [Polyangiaceae bacterium]|nr:transposase family protein [Polyangiaceae bacterium]
LEAHGYVLEARGKRPRGEPPQRFEAPRPNALWQADFTEVRVHDDKLYVLVMLDDFSRFVVGRAYRPKGGGKVESAIRTLKRELWELEEFHDREHAAARLREFFLECNEDRAHMGIDGVTPADRYFGRADRVLAQVQEAARGRHAMLASVA